MASLCACNLGLTVAAEVSLTEVSNTQSFNINLDHILKKITTSKICKPLCKTQNVSEKKCRDNTESVRSCDHWYDVVCQTEKAAEEVYNDAKHLVCDVVEVAKVIENAGCAVVDDVQKGVCKIILDIEKDFQLTVSGTWYSFVEVKASETAGAGASAAEGAGIAFHIETIQLNDIKINNPLGKNPIFIDCELVLSASAFGPNCAICQTIPNTTINESDEYIDFSMGNITWSVCITGTGPVINIKANANINSTTDPSIGFAGLVSFGIPIPVF